VLSAFSDPACTTPIAVTYASAAPPYAVRQTPPPAVATEVDAVGAQTTVYQMNPSTNTCDPTMAFAITSPVPFTTFVEGTATVDP
jgi:hypothetical protein